jgi:FkbM family methyltransferase
MNLAARLWTIAQPILRIPPQPFWRLAHRLALAQMGIGTGSHCDNSGERHVLRVLARILPPCPTLLDVGANRGQYTRLLATAFPTSTIHSLEPSPSTFELLTEHVSTIPNVRAHNIGLSRTTQVTSLYSDQAGSGLASLHNRRLDHLDISFDRTEAVTLHSLDRFCLDNNISHVHFMKLDVEGHELAVFEGAAALLQQDAISVVQFEFGGCNIHSRTYFQDFFDLLAPRFDLFRVLPYTLYPISHYRETDEVFVTTNYVAFSRARVNTRLAA